MNFPFEEKVNKSDVMWRYSQNPVIQRDAIPTSNSIFNSAVVKFKDGYAGVFRCDNKARAQELHRGFSKDGINWDIDEKQIDFICSDPEIKYYRGYDPRVCFIEDRYYVTWCNAYKDMPTIGMAYTFDFEKFYQLENSFLPFNRNGVMFPKKINGKYAMLSRPSDNGHTPFGDIFYSDSPDLTYWGHHRHVMASGGSGWQSTKIGAGPIPIETSEGWLLIYHGVLTSCNGFVYSCGGAILDINEPWKVKYRTEPYIMSPQTNYECVGDVPNVFFPCATINEGDKLAMYYGAADTVTGLCFGYISEIVDFIKKNSL